MKISEIIEKLAKLAKLAKKSRNLENLDHLEGGGQISKNLDPPLKVEIETQP